MSRIALGVLVAFNIGQGALAQIVPRPAPPQLHVAPPLTAPGNSITLDRDRLNAITLPPPPPKLELHVPHGHAHCDDEKRRDGKC